MQKSTILSSDLEEYLLISDYVIYTGAEDQWKESLYEFKNLKTLDKFNYLGVEKSMQIEIINGIRNNITSEILKTVKEQDEIKPLARSSKKEIDKISYQDLLDSMDKSIEKLRGKKRYNDYLLDVLNGKNTGKQKFDKETVKQVPIPSVMDRQPISKIGNRWKYLCPLHNEKSPSFTYYADQNTFHCYGCGAGGDVVELYMKLNNKSFIEALKDLSSMFG